MKKVVTLAIVALLGLSSCDKKKHELQPEQHPTEQKGFTGIVFTQIDADTMPAYWFSIQRFLTDSTTEFLFMPNSALSGNLKDSIPLQLHSGDSLLINCWKENNEPYIECNCNTNYQMNTKIYLNGTLKKDTTDTNGVFWIKL